MDDVFDSKSGAYVIKPAPILGTSLTDVAGTVVALFINLDAGSVAGAKGSGRLPEKGQTFDWKLDSQ